MSATMQIQPGTNLRQYRIVAPLGAGGMGEVYRAHDTKLGREVAIKVLPAAVAQDPDRLARFKREAQVLASLNHPNIAAIYGLEDADDVQFLVLELVEEEDLAEHLLRGRMPIDDALAIARQIADALVVAHEKGIVHRDLKPANVKLTPDGKAKVLDFGLAKAAAGRCLGRGRTRPRQRPHHDACRDDGRDGPGHWGLHEPRAGAREACRPAHRRLGIRLRALRDAHRRQGVHR